LPLAVAIVCLVLAAIGLRPGIVSIGPILPDMIAAFGLTYTQASLLTAIPTVLMGLLALPTPWLVRRFGRDRLVIAALGLLALATAARAVTGSTAGLFAATAGIGAGIAIAGALVPGFVKAGFPGRVALMMGVYALALSIGSTFAAATTGFLAQAFGSWRGAASLWAVPPLLGLGAWLLVEARGRKEVGVDRAAARDALPWRNPTAWLVATFFALNNLVFYSYVSWIAPIYIEFGSSPTSAGLILACFTVAFMTATPLFGAMSRNEDRRVFLALASAIGLAGVVWLAVAPTVLPFAAVSLVAFGAGGAFTLSMTLPLDNARTDGEATAWNAFVMLVSYLVGATGPLLVGVLRDATGGFHAPLWTLVAVSVAMLATTPFLQPHHHRVSAASRRDADPNGELK
jgi:CP family cyanate transporter-like MFS transporter